MLLQPHFSYLSPLAADRLTVDQVAAGEKVRRYRQDTQGPAELGGDQEMLEEGMSRGRVPCPCAPRPTPQHTGGSTETRGALPRLSPQGAENAGITSLGIQWKHLTKTSEINNCPQAAGAGPGAGPTHRTGLVRVDGSRAGDSGQVYRSRILWENIVFFFLAPKNFKRFSYLCTHMLTYINIHITNLLINKFKLMDGISNNHF